MQERTLRKVALIVLIVGLSFLYFYADEFEVEAVGSLEHYGIEEYVKISGVVTQVSSHENVQFIKVEGTRVQSLEVVIFTGEQSPLTVGDYVEIEGQVEEYEGKKEVIGQKIIVR